MSFHPICRAATLTLGLLGACKAADPGPPIQIVGDSARIRIEDPIPHASPWLHGTTVSLVGARGETIGFQVLHRDGGAVTLTLPIKHVSAFDVHRAKVVRASTDLYGGSHGTGAYPDELVPVAATTATTDPAYFEVQIDRDMGPGQYLGTLAVGDTHLTVTLDVAAVTLPPLPIGAWAEYDPGELGGTMGEPTMGERACIAMFRDHGVLLSPMMPVDAYAARRELLSDSPFVPALIPTDPAAAGDAVKEWIAATTGHHQIPFAIPIDEPAAAARPKVRALAQAVRDAGGGPGRFVFAVTDAPHAEYGDLIDRYITLEAHLTDSIERWTYNGAPPRAGTMVVDGEAPGTRTWGWIGWRYKLPIWYAWEGLYWHDRYNHKPAPPRKLDVGADATSFDAGEDHGNLDGVLAMPADRGTTCHPTLRLAALRRGLEDRQLLDLAAACDPSATAKLAESLVPRALGDADAHGKPAWPTDEAAWEAARRKLLELAACKR